MSYGAYISGLDCYSTLIIREYWVSLDAVSVVKRGSDENKG